MKLIIILLLMTEFFYREYIQTTTITQSLSSKILKRNWADDVA